MKVTPAPTRLGSSDQPIDDQILPKPDVEQWLRGSTVEDALKMQKPAPDDAIVIRPEDKKVA